MLNKIFRVSVVAAVAVLGWGADRAAADSEVVCPAAKVAFTPPGPGWVVKTDLTYPVAATLTNHKLNGRITLTYTDYDIYGFKINYGFLVDKLKSNEENSLKLTKPNYSRISLDDRKFQFGKAARLEFSFFDELGYHHTVVYALANGTIVLFISAESLEREWPVVNEDLEKLMASVRFTP